MCVKYLLVYFTCVKYVMITLVHLKILLCCSCLILNINKIIHISIIYISVMLIFFTSVNTIDCIRTVVSQRIVCFSGV